ncbi:2-oxoglutarate oxidoreductase [Anaerosporomusa subterranea]|uniref:2-oxoglutarate oxidoreductase n=1 Tax=Anaerosporomusa subterranea TaxID=1794912 RepID=A0A154BTC2_ANASB|nr:thiamine pyrophosphate-dependent enzyme [Anaerosporomusa subterranea]KYZ77171.1 2-oxoglutarate oxidoreductase [Anaerosporomusa subterranea]
MAEVLFSRPKSLLDIPMHYCPGCHHGIIHRLVAEVLDELNVRERTIGIAPVGCSVLAYEYFNCDMMEAAHGRAPAVATGVKRVLPESVVFTYQGDGDLAAIGCAEIIHAAVRGEKITTIFVNNAIYGMTGGQMAPTSLESQVTTTSPYGRKLSESGMPIRMSEMISTIDGAAYITRVAVNNPANMAKAKSSIKTAFQLQMSGAGFSMVEVLSTCPTNWGMTPLEAVKWLEQNMIPYYPLGVFKTPEGVAKV